MSKENKTTVVMISQLSSTHKINRISRVLLVMVVLCGWASTMAAQGWERIFGGTKIDEGYQIVETRDQGYLVVGISESFGEDNDIDVYVLKTDVDGEEEWSYVFDEGFIEHAYDAVEAPDGGVVIVGDIIDSFGDHSDVYVIKVSSKGKVLWSRRFGSIDQDEVGRKLTNGIDGGYVITGESFNPETENQEIITLKISEEGEEEWFRTFGTAKDDSGRGIAAIGQSYILAAISENPEGIDNDIKLFELNIDGDVKSEQSIQSDEDEGVFDIISTTDGGFAITGFVTDNNDALVAKYNQQMRQEWLLTYDLFGLGDQGQSIVQLNDGSFVVAGFTEENSVNVDFFLAKISPNGEKLWVNTTGSSARTDFAGGLTSTANGGFAYTGRSSKFLDFFDDMVLIKTDGNGNTITSFIEGTVFQDACNAFEPNGNLPLGGWLVQAEGIDKTYLGTTDENGEFSIRVDTGEYNVTIFPVNPYWKTCVPGGYIVNVEEFYSNISLNFPITGEINCPYMEVDVSTPFLAACDMPIVYTVNYCNLGTAPAFDSYVEVSIDDKLEFNTSSIAYSSQSGNTYTFNLGDLPVSYCGNFTISTTLECENLIAEGQASLVSAHIYPDTICTEPDPNWDGSSVIVRGQCANDSLFFELENVGEGNMASPKKMIVIEDNVIWFTRPYQLDANGVFSIEPIEANGKTYRVVAEQSDGHPGRSFPSLALEGCGGDGTNISTGMVGQFRENDLDPFVSVDVKEYNPITEVATLRGYPKGYGDNGIISPQTDITYTITFSNFGIDTVDRVVIRDTLPKSLDISSFTPGASSHPYIYEIYDEGIVKFTFDNISLVPLNSSAANEQPFSTGFVTFQLSQNPENPSGTIIKNSAAIFLEDQVPVSTNLALHVIQDFPGYIEERTTAVPDSRFESAFEVKISPNPFSEMTTFTIEGPVDQFGLNERVRFELFDGLGRVVNTDYFSLYDDYRFFRNHLPGGLYVYRLSLKGELIGSGKLLIE